MSSTAKSYTCEVCGSTAATLRRGRCWICYIRWADTRPVGLGASCTACQERRRENLRMVELQGTWKPMCHNCAAKTLRLAPMPRTIEGIRQSLHRDRRWNERRQGKKDSRIFAIERRTEQRRTSSRGDELDWFDAEDLIIEIIDLEDPTAEPTRIVEKVASPSENQPPN